MCVFEDFRVSSADTALCGPRLLNRYVACHYDTEYMYAIAYVHSGTYMVVRSTPWDVSQ